MKKYRATMYSMKPFPKEMRTTFELPGDPYRHETHESGKAAIEFLRELGVVFYRDEFNTRGILIQPNDGDTTPLAVRKGFEGYRMECVLETDNKSFIRIAGWDRPTPEYVAKAGDDRAWLHFNQHRLIVSMDWEAVALG